ncbi:MAG: LamG domain-containing protein [Planctomycetes bacterium]|nr:LamG domain-containing protein [Planctomycetota bacterium]
MDEGSGATASDVSGLGLDGTLSGPTWTSGRLGNALSFANTSDNVAIDAADVPLPWTASLWVRRQDSSLAWAELMDTMALGSGGILMMEANSTNRVGIALSATADYIFNSTAPIGTWTHLTYAAKSGSPSLYVNGVFVESLGNTVSLPRGSLGSQAATGSWSFVGAIDEVRLYGGLLNPTEILALAALGGSARDTSGARLDGEFSGTFPSGDGSAGGDFVSTFTIRAVPAASGRRHDRCGSVGLEFLLLPAFVWLWRRRRR